MRQGGELESKSLCRFLMMDLSCDWMSFNTDSEVFCDTLGSFKKKEEKTCRSSYLFKTHYQTAKLALVILNNLSNPNTVWIRLNNAAHILLHKQTYVPKNWL